jgi:pyruvate/2-oxoglutarate dehydrogenase complex dihydrolipoamide acyltransferase (E2) component
MLTTITLPQVGVPVRQTTAASPHMVERDLLKCDEPRVIDSTPVINRPHAAILSMEAIVKPQAAVHNSLAVQPTTNIILSVDQHSVDGLLAGRFAQAAQRALKRAASICTA